MKDRTQPIAREPDVSCPQPSLEAAGRRRFLAAIMAAAAVTGYTRTARAYGQPQVSSPANDANAPPGSAGVPAGRKLDKIGLQLYTVRDALKQDFDGTLHRVAAVGYREVEFAGYAGRSPAEVRASLTRAALEAPSTHIAAESLGTDFPHVLESAKIIGHRYVVVASAPGVSSLDDYRRLADRLNRAGDIADKAGVRLGYHNHDAEFRPVDGKMPMEILLQSTGPKVCFELDTYWVVKAGQSPIAWLDRAVSRFELLHLKDAAGADRTMADVGAGAIDFPRILAHATNLKHVFVERDDAPDPFASIGASIAYLHRLSY